MDIFTTQLTRVVPVTVKPQKLKVKSLAKDAKSSKLDVEHDHMDGHDLNTVTQQHAQAKYKGKEGEQNKEAPVEDKEAEHNVDEVVSEGTIPSEHPSLTRADLLKQAASNKAHSNNDKSIEQDEQEPKPEHLDIFV